MKCEFAVFVHRLAIGVHTNRVDRKSPLVILKTAFLEGCPYCPQVFSIKHITGELHNNENVIAIVYEGDDAIQKVRKAVGATNPDEAPPESIRGKYGKIHTKTACHETVIHASDIQENAEREIKLWFDESEIVN